MKNEIPFLFKTICENLLRAEHAPKGVGRRRIIPHSVLLHEIWKMAKTGMQWRMLKPPTCSWKTVHHYFSIWSHEHVFKRAYIILLKLWYRRRVKGDRLHIIDSTYIKNVYGIDCVGRNPTDRGRKATKMSAIVNDEGMPISIQFMRGNCSDTTTVGAALQGRMIKPLKQHIPFMGEKGYPSRANSLLVTSHGYLDRISRKLHTIGARQNAKRCTVEHTFSWIDKYRRLILRYDKYIQNYESFTYISIGSILSNRM